jgi:hypothetical protein
VNNRDSLCKVEDANKCPVARTSVFDMIETLRYNIGHVKENLLLLLDEQLELYLPPEELMLLKKHITGKGEMECEPTLPASEAILRLNSIKDEIDNINDIVSFIKECIQT